MKETLWLDRVTETDEYEGEHALDPWRPANGRPGPGALEDRAVYETATALALVDNPRREAVVSVHPSRSAASSAKHWAEARRPWSTAMSLYLHTRILGGGRVALVAVYNPPYDPPTTGENQA